MSKNAVIPKPFEVESIYLDYEKAVCPFADDYLPPADSWTSGSDHHPAWHFEFDKAIEQGLWWNFVLPRNFLKQHPVKVKVYWYAPTKTAGGVLWGVRFIGRKEGEIWETADFGTEVTALGTVQDVALELTVTEILIPPDKHVLEEKDIVVLQLARKAGDEDDDLDEDAAVAMVDFEFARDPEIVRGY